MNKFFVIFLGLIIFSAGARAQSAGSLDQSANNSQGVYQQMDLGYAGFTSLGMTQAAWLDPLQNLGEGQTKPAYSKYYWYEDLVLPIRLRENMVTLVNFPEWEMIESLQFGNITAFSGEIVGPSTVLLWSKGNNIGVDTNVIVFGRSGNKYVFYLKSEGVDTERLTNAIVDIEVPEEGAAEASNGFSGGSSASSGSLDGINTKTRRFQKQDWLKEIPFNPADLRFDMEVYVPNPEDVVIAPERVWRDDVFTYIDLGEKALTMVQRPIVTQIVERSEMPVGFRSKGPNNRLIIVEGIGDFVLRNGKRIICLKLRRDDSKGVMDYTSYEDSPSFQKEWDVPPALPDFLTPKTGAGAANNASNANKNNVVQGFGPISQGQGYVQEVDVYQGNGSQQRYGGQGLVVEGFSERDMAGGQDMLSYKEGVFDSSILSSAMSGNISVQLGTGDNIENMEDLWDNLSSKHPDVLSGYEPFFSVDAPADGEGRELFHLRISPISNLEEGDDLCSKLGRRGVFCSVVRTQ